MKKSAPIALALIFVLFLCACEGLSNPDVSETKGSAEPTLPEPQIFTSCSPDGKYLMEGYGIDYGPSGMSAFEGIRIVETDGGKTALLPV